MAPTMESKHSEVIVIDEARKKYIKGNYRKALVSYVELAAFHMLRLFLTAQIQGRDDDDDENTYTADKNLD